jgi:hypothetical protein
MMMNNIRVLYDGAKKLLAFMILFPDDLSGSFLPLFIACQIRRLYPWAWVAIFLFSSCVFSKRSARVMIWMVFKDCSTQWKSSLALKRVVAWTILIRARESELAELLPLNTM